MIEFINGAVKMSTNELKYGITQALQGNLEPVVSSAMRVHPGTAAVAPYMEAEDLLTDIAGQNIESATGGAVPALVGSLAVGAVIPGPGEFRQPLNFAKGADKTQLIKRSQEVEKLATKIQEYRAIGKTSRIGKTEAKLSSAQSNILPATPENPKVYPANLVEAQKLVQAEKLKRQTTETLHLHHKLPKGMSAAFFDRMDYFISKGKATTDDLLEMADEATKIGLTTGDLRSNILPIADKPHTTLHTEMRAMGSGMFGRMELGKKELMVAMREAKDPVSLKALWKAWINDDAKYLVETAEVWEPLDNLLKEIRGK